MRASDMPQQVKALASKPHDLNMTPRTQSRRRESAPSMLFSDLLKSTMAHGPTPINK